MFSNHPLYREDVKRLAELPLPWEKLAGKKLLLTGASGLIGTLLTDVLMYRNRHNDLQLSLYAAGRNEEKARKRFGDYGENDKFYFLRFDVNQPIEVDIKPDFIIHAASNTHPRLYAEDPVGSLMTNLQGLANLLELGRAAHSRRFVFISSVEIYGQALQDDDIFDEKYCGYIDCNMVRAAYPEGKRAGEALCQAYRSQYGMDIVIPRLSRVYGPTMRLDDSKAMSQFIQNGLRHEDIVLKSKGEQLFSYCYAADAVAGLLYVLLKGLDGEAYNIAEDAEKSLKLRDIVDLIAAYAGTKVTFDLPDAVEATGFSKVSVGVMDNSKVKKTGWNMEYDLRQGLNRTLEIMSQGRDSCECLGLAGK